MPEEAVLCVPQGQPQAGAEGGQGTPRDRMCEVSKATSLLVSRPISPLCLGSSVQEDPAEWRQHAGPRLLREAGGQDPEDHAWLAYQPSQRPARSARPDSRHGGRGGAAGALRPCVTATPQPGAGP